MSGPGGVVATSCENTVAKYTKGLLGKAMGNVICDEFCALPHCSS